MSGLTIAGFITLVCTCVGMFLNVRNSVKTDQRDAISEREERAEMKVMLRSMKEALDKALLKLDTYDSDINALKIENGVFRELLKSLGERIERVENQNEKP